MRTKLLLLLVLFSFATASKADEYDLPANNSAVSFVDDYSLIHSYEISDESTYFGLSNELTTKGLFTNTISIPGYISNITDFANQTVVFFHDITRLNRHTKVATISNSGQLVNHSTIKDDIHTVVKFNGALYLFADRPNKKKDHNLVIYFMDSAFNVKKITVKKGLELGQTEAYGSYLFLTMNNSAKQKSVLARISTAGVITTIIPRAENLDIQDFNVLGNTVIFSHIPHDSESNTLIVRAVDAFSRRITLQKRIKCENPSLEFFEDTTALFFSLDCPGDVVEVYRHNLLVDPILMLQDDSDDEEGDSNISDIYINDNDALSIVLNRPKLEETQIYKDVDRTLINDFSFAQNLDYQYIATVNGAELFFSDDLIVSRDGSTEETLFTLSENIDQSCETSITAAMLENGSTLNIYAEADHSDLREFGACSNKLFEVDL